MKRTIVAAAVAGLALGLTAQPAQARDGSATTDDCINVPEFKAVKPSDVGGLNKTEDYFGVSRGEVVHTASHGDLMVRRYKWCNHNRSEGYFDLSYLRNKAGNYVTLYIIWWDFTCHGGSLSCGHPPAKGDPNADTRHCVANREANSIKWQYGRTKLERMWEVVGLGERANVPPFGTLVIYPWCDHAEGSWVGVYYKDRHPQGIVWYDSAYSKVRAL